MHARGDSQRGSDNLKAQTDYSKGHTGSKTLELPSPSPVISRMGGVQPVTPSIAVEPTFTHKHIHTVIAKEGQTT